jgi:hypothetical protein
MTMDRRQSFSMLAAASLSGCSFYYGRKVTDREIPMAEEVGTLRHTLTDVNALRMHSLTSIGPVSSDAPVIVLVHGVRSLRPLYDPDSSGANW